MIYLYQTRICLYKKSNVQKAYYKREDQYVAKKLKKFKLYLSMKITPTLCIAFAIILSVQFNSNAQALEKQFSGRELQEDFKAFRTKYESMLANLYLYTPKPQLDKVFDSLYQNIQPMTVTNFYTYITPVSSYIKDGHANIYLPEDVTEYNSEHADYFPFNVYWHHDSLYISMNLSEDTTLKEGTEILDINGKSAKEIMDYLLARQVRDGNNNQYPSICWQGR